jgi:hypothetical protein
VKIIAQTAEFAKRTQVTLQWRNAFYFAGEQPEPRRLITLDLPGLQKNEADAIIKWLSGNALKRAVKALVSKNRKQIREFSRKHWSYTKLDDFLEADNYQSFSWSVSQHFTLAELIAFERKELPRAWAACDELFALPESDRDGRYAKLKELEEFLRRRHATVYNAPNRAVIEYSALAEEREKEQYTAFQEVQSSGPLAPMEWAKFIAQLRSSVARTACSRLGELMSETYRHKRDELAGTLEQLAKKKRFADLADGYASGFWNQLHPWVSLPPTETSGTFDISDAVEVVVPGRFQVVRAKRIGQIVPGRRALVIPAASSKQQPIYIRGDRQLKLLALSRDGMVHKHGCDLTVHTDGVSIRPLLNQVEELIVLSNLSPSAALARIGDLDVPDDHPVWAVAKKAVDDYRYATILGDLLIELRTGLDADVARRLVG